MFIGLIIDIFVVKLTNHASPIQIWVLGAPNLYRYC